jgi:N6-adenosine-specific RNA methylase IME4
MTADEIAALPVAELADSDAHLYLWTTNGYLRRSFEIVEGWGFRPSTVLTWCKPPRGIGFGGAYTITTEFVLFARRGSLPPLARMDSTWWEWRRDSPSKKPDAFLDIVEQVSPEPRAELFARRARFGWDYPIGDQALGGVDWRRAA